MQMQNLETKTLIDPSGFGAPVVAALRLSIERVGVVDPLVVFEDATGQHFVVDGRKRLRAALSLGLLEVPCVLHRHADGASLQSVRESIAAAEFTRKEASHYDRCREVEALAAQGLSAESIAATTTLSLRETQNYLLVCKNCDPSLLKAFERAPTVAMLQFLLRVECLEPRDQREELSRFLSQSYGQRVMPFADPPPAPAKKKKRAARKARALRVRPAREVETLAMLVERDLVTSAGWSKPTRAAVSLVLEWVLCRTERYPVTLAPERTHEKATERAAEKASEKKESSVKKKTEPRFGVVEIDD